MGYLVIKNGANKKSYQCTNTCNKPRLRVGNSYVPITNNTKTTMRARVSGSYIADYKSYTYTGEQGTVTTGTTYLTRTETTGTTYQTRASTSKTVYGTTTSSGSCYSLDYHGYGTYVMVNSGWAYNGGGGNVNYTKLVNATSDYKGYGWVRSWESFFTISGITFETYSKWNGQYEGGAIYTGYGDASIYRTYIRGNTTVTTGTSYKTRASTYNTLYGTRASTSGTSYGTKTTNKTLTSYSWG